MREIVEYKIISRDFIFELTESIFCCMKDGWQPLGGFVYMPNGKCAQAVVKCAEGTSKWEQCVDAKLKALDEHINQVAFGSEDG